MTSIVKFVGCLLAFALTLLAGSSPASALTPTHLAQMPSVADVQRKLPGKDALDAAGHQAGAFRSLLFVVRALSAGGEFGNQLTSDESALIAAYGAASNQASTRGRALLAARKLPAVGPNSVASNWLHEEAIYGDSESFRKQTLALLAPQILSLYEARRGAASSSSPPSAGGLPGSAAPSLPSLGILGLDTERVTLMGVAAVVLILLLFLVFALIGTFNKLQGKRGLVHEARDNLKAAENKYAQLMQKQYQIVRRYEGAAALPYVQLNQSAEAGIAVAQQAGAMFHAVQNFAERYPQLKLDQSFQHLTGDLRRCLEEIQFKQEAVNRLAREFNGIRGHFPTVVFASILRIRAERSVELDVSGAQEKAVATDFMSHAPGAPNAPPALASAPAPAPPQALQSAPPAHALSGQQAGAAGNGWSAAPQQSAYPLPAPGGPASSARAGGTEAHRAIPDVSIRFLSGPLAGRRVPVGMGAVIGREASMAQIVVADAQVSGGHAWLGMTETSLIFVDRGSTNGSIVNGAPVFPQAHVPMKHGDVVTLGRTNSVSFVVELA
ncbi:MAG TPA: LemA family protein [Polyangiaceae bacterium]